MFRLAAFPILIVVAVLTAGAGLADDDFLTPNQAATIKKLTALPKDNVAAAFDAEFRPAADHARDGVEKADAILRASGIRRDTRVGDVLAGDGYLVQLLVAAVYQYGRVWANNDPASIDAATGAAWTKRLEDPSAANIARLDQPLSSPFPGYVLDLDLIFSRYAYADAVRRGIDRSAMNHDLFATLKPGGRLVIVDARAGDDADPASAAALCRVPEALVRKELESAGFRFVSSGSELRDKGDASSASACGAEAARRSMDRLLLVFEKP
ncbi:MAG TPA: hypothetical protein VGK20_11915 [Candidatus Binatia bacterium]|jgi:predicted methyltransferase